MADIRYSFPAKSEKMVKDIEVSVRDVSMLLMAINLLVMRSQTCGSMIAKVLFAKRFATMSVITGDKYVVC